ncbi:hypothetical protein FQZ97_1005160 [compost metagenome]
MSRPTRSSACSDSASAGAFGSTGERASGPASKPLTMVAPSRAACSAQAMLSATANTAIRGSTSARKPSSSAAGSRAFTTAGQAPRV